MREQRCQCPAPKRVAGEPMLGLRHRNVLPLPLGVALLLGFGGCGGLTVEAHDEIGIGAAHTDEAVLVVLLNFLMAFFGVIKCLPDGVRELRRLVAVAHQVGAVAAEFGVGLLEVVEQRAVGSYQALVVKHGAGQQQRVVLHGVLVRDKRLPVLAATAQFLHVGEVERVQLYQRIECGGL